MTVNGKTKLLAIAILVALALPIVSIAPAQACCCDCGPGVGTPGYWKNHPDDWPLEAITFDGVTYYTKDQAIWWMNQPVQGDKSITMFKAVVAAMLNAYAGNCAECITIEPKDWGSQGQWWLTEYPVGSGVAASSEAWQASHGELIYYWLDQYNNGKLCATSRDALEMEDD